MVVCRHCFGEACLVIWVAGVQVAGVEADSAVADLVAVVDLAEDLVAVVTLVAVDRVGVGNTDFTDRKRIKY